MFAPQQDLSGPAQFKPQPRQPDACPPSRLPASAHLALLLIYSLSPRRLRAPQGLRLSSSLTQGWPPRPPAPASAQDRRANEVQGGGLRDHGKAAWARCVLDKGPRARGEWKTPRRPAVPGCSRHPRPPTSPQRTGDVLELHRVLWKGEALSQPRNPGRGFYVETGSLQME